MINSVEKTFSLCAINAFILTAIPPALFLVNMRKNISRTFEQVGTFGDYLVDSYILPGFLPALGTVSSWNKYFPVYYGLFLSAIWYTWDLNVMDPQQIFPLVFRDLFSATYFTWWIGRGENISILKRIYIYITNLLLTKYSLSYMIIIRKAYSMHLISLPK